MNKEGKITICVLTLMIIGFIVTKIDAQHKHLEDTINKSELRLDSVVNEYQNLNLHYR